VTPAGHSQAHRPKRTMAGGTPVTVGTSRGRWFTRAVKVGDGHAVSTRLSELDAVSQASESSPVAPAIAGRAIKGTPFGKARG